MTGVRDGINYGVGLCLACGLGIGFDGDAYGITLELDEIIYFFREIFFRVVMMEIFRVL